MMSQPASASTRISITIRRLPESVPGHHPGLALELEGIRLDGVTRNEQPDEQ